MQAYIIIKIAKIRKSDCKKNEGARFPKILLKRAEKNTLFGLCPLSPLLGQLNSPGVMKCRDGAGGYPTASISL